MLILTGALEGKTRLLVTNQLQYLPQADQVHTSGSASAMNQASASGILALELSRPQCWQCWLPKELHPQLVAVVESLVISP